MFTYDEKDGNPQNTSNAAWFEKIAREAGMETAKEFGGMYSSVHKAAQKAKEAAGTETGMAAALGIAGAALMIGGPMAIKHLAKRSDDIGRAHEEIKNKMIR